MIKILKHRKSKTSMRWRFPKRGFVMVYGGFVNITGLEQWRIDALVKQGFQDANPKSVPVKLRKHLKISEGDLIESFKICEIEGCNNKIELGKTGSHFRKYCDECKEQRERVA